MGMPAAVHEGCLRFSGQIPYIWSAIDGCQILSRLISNTLCSTPEMPPDEIFTLRQSFYPLQIRYPALALHFGTIFHEPQECGSESVTHQGSLYRWKPQEPTDKWSHEFLGSTLRVVEQLILESPPLEAQQNRCLKERLRMDDPAAPMFHLNGFCRTL